MAIGANKDDEGIEDAAILLMSLGEEEAAQVFKHLGPKEVQRLGETIAQDHEGRSRASAWTEVLDKFGDGRAVASTCWWPDTDEYVKAVRCASARSATTRRTC